MKHSDWDIWKKKLDELPVNSDAGLSWEMMQSVLDKNMPLVSPSAGGSSIVKLIVKKVISALSYILPAAAMVTAVTYISLNDFNPEMQHAKKKFRPDALLIPRDTVIYNDSVELSNRDSGAFNPDQHRSTKPATGDTSISAQKALPGNSAEGDGSLQQLSATPIYLQLTRTPLGDDMITKLQERLDQLKLSEPGNLFKADRILCSGRNIQSQAREQKSNQDKITKAKTVRTKSLKLKKTKTKPPKTKAHIQGNKGLNYGPEAGINAGKGYGVTIYYGASASYALNDRLLVSTGLKINTKRILEGSYTHPSYNLNDPDAPPLRIVDSRKFSALDVPLQLEYQLYNGLSIKAGPVLTLQSKQNGPGSRFDKIINPYDTVYHSRPLNEAISNTQVNKVRAAFSGGIKLQLKKFSIEAGYLRNLSPYKVSSALGSYQKTYSTFSFGVGYRFK